eukprot:GFUD01138598.1.p1 GENE.GFUD01138598.1~~GFUD01138598.1.p1  ORF type:complete len:134 (-),score=9.88 GFUD01138598.1:145-546(-)
MSLLLSSTFTLCLMEPYLDLNLRSQAMVLAWDQIWQFRRLAVSRTEVVLGGREQEPFTLARIASAREFGAVTQRLLSAESTDVEVAGDGVCVGVQGDGGPVVQEGVEMGNFHSGLSLITWVTSLERHSSSCSS